MDQDKLDRFLKDLTKLTKKHHLEISGCGCCGSPLVSEVKPSNGGYYEISHDDDTQHFAEGLNWKD